MRRYAAVFIMSLSLVSLPSIASALTHAGSYKVPLTPSFDDCGVEGSTDDTCSGSPGADLESDFIFDRGTVQIASNGRVGLKFDEIQVKDGVLCPDERCSCYSTNNPCEEDSDCTSGNCVVNDNTDVKVEIWAQGFWAADPFWLPDPCGDGSNADCVRRNELVGAGMTMCHRTFILEVKTNQRGQVDSQTATSDGFVCGAGSAPGSGTIRRIEVSINNEGGSVKDGDDDFPVWKLIARPSWNPGVNTAFAD